MTERASRPLSQLGWAALGAIPMGCVAALASTFIFYNSSFAVAVGITYLLVVIPMCFCIAVVLWVGYVAGSRLANHASRRKSNEVVLSGLLALACGLCAIIAVSVSVEWFRIPYMQWACLGALTGGTASVLLAQHLPRRRIPRATGWESTFGEE
jgi:uncharacterized membrane protein YfcA